MAVIHILKDGTVVKDITGRVVRLQDAVPLYNLIQKINNSNTYIKRLHYEKSS